MYDELVKRLRETSCGAENTLWWQAADAIEELSAYAKLYEELTDKGQKTARKLLDAYPKWISVEEALPEGADKSGAICENVWLLFDDGGVYPGWMNGITEKVYYLNDYDDIVRKAPISRVKMWQPRPEPPKEET